jgi:hypothetical protein
MGTGKKAAKAIHEYLLKKNNPTTEWKSADRIAF